MPKVRVKSISNQVNELRYKAMIKSLEDKISDLKKDLEYKDTKLHELLIENNFLKGKLKVYDELIPSLLSELEDISEDDIARIDIYKIEE